MYLDSSKITKKGKSYNRHLLRTSFRQDGKVKHRTIANLSQCSDEEIRAIKLALKNKHQLSSLISIKDIKTSLDKRIGAVWVLNLLAQRLGITASLGKEQQGKLALLQVMSRTICQGSRLKAVRMAKSHALCEVVGIDSLTEDDLYKNLAWLDENQEAIEKKLFEFHYKEAVPHLFLYDVTSSYLEGVCNELADFGYNRDGKKGKAQVVIGLLTGPDGDPVAVRVFEGNTQDTRTVSEQVRTVAQNFGVKEVTLVGDRGMLKGPQIAELPEDFRYLTAITKPQVRTMLKEGVLQYELFTEDVCEVQHEGVRYILRRNKERARQLMLSREDKLACIGKLAKERTEYLLQHSKAKAETALKKVYAKAKQLKVDKWVQVFSEARTIVVEKDDVKLAGVSLLDGCYVIKSDLSKDKADSQTLHDRYCDLEKVERAFRTIKTVHLEMRPIYVRKKESTRGHAFVVMLALLIQRELERRWVELDITVEEGIDELGSIRMEKIMLGNAVCLNIPEPDELAQKLLDMVDVQLPSVLPDRRAFVHTKKKLPSERKK